MMNKTSPIALAAAGICCLSPMATADFNAEITTWFVPIETVVFTNHAFGSTDTASDTSGMWRPAGAFPIHITTGASTLAGWDYQFEIDYTDYDIFFFGPSAATKAEIDILNSTYAGVVDVIALDANNNAIGNVSFTSDSIDWNSTSSNVVNGGEVVTIHWMVPAPGALALLAVAGFVGTRRRRS